MCGAVLFSQTVEQCGNQRSLWVFTVLVLSILGITGIVSDIGSYPGADYVIFLIYLFKLTGYLVIYLMISACAISLRQSYFYRCAKFSTLPGELCVY